MSDRTCLTNLFPQLLFGAVDVAEIARVSMNGATGSFVLPNISEFTYRSARSGSLVFGLCLAIVVETVVMHLWLRVEHPLLAWALTVASVFALAWLAADYRALGRGAIRIDSLDLDLRVGRRVAVRVPLGALESVVQPSWQQVPAAGLASSRDYRNLMKPATPNILITLAEPIVLRLPGGLTRSIRRLGLRLDDPAGFIAALDRRPSGGTIPRR